MLELCYESCDESGPRASSYVWNALATTTVKKLKYVSYCTTVFVQTSRTVLKLRHLGSI